jgi:hypothetical protein
MQVIATLQSLLHAQLDQAKGSAASMAAGKKVRLLRRR